MNTQRRLHFACAAALIAALTLSGCATRRDLDSEPADSAAAASEVVGEREKGREVVMHAFDLIGIGYRFGGKNPDSGLDCSGMVAYLYKQVAGITLPHSAAAMARLGKKIPRSALQEGDLVFFNTRNKPNSHVGIYVGEGRFVHAPRRNGKIEISSLSNRYFDNRFEGARTLLSD